MAIDEMIFADAVQIRSPADRADFIERACGGDAELRRQVESLLLAHDGARDFLSAPLVDVPLRGTTIGLNGIADRPATRSGAPAAISGEDVGHLVGPYKLLERLGEGGMGTVFMAEQLHPVRRKVAIKIVKPGMDSRQVIARFEAERQALAMMDHPGIARVLDAGTTEAGRPYFAMELVRGVAITEYCDAQHLTPRERLALFAHVCQAVQHAHQKGIIHRDLKPGNVLVTLHDGVPVPKVIDFGIAKATAGQTLTERTLFTQYAQLVGTPLYMSPEQAEFSGLDVDTRSDIYSLGVLLYELLTGTTPFDKRRLGRAALDEVRRIIREEDPPRPSTRLSTLAAEALAGVSASRKTEARRLGQLVRGELDWIVMRCLEKDRTRRYETAIGLARDVERYLADEPVLAHPPKASYRFGKFLRRHRGPAVAAALLFLALVGGVVGTSAGMVRAERAHQRQAEQRRVADDARKEESKQRARAEGLARAAEVRLVQIEQINELLSSIFQELDPNPESNRVTSLRITLAQRLDRVAAQLQGDSVGDAVAVAKLQNVLGCTQRHLGYPHKAIPLLNQARQTLGRELGVGHPLEVEATNNLAVSYLHAGMPEKAIPLLEKTAVKIPAGNSEPLRKDVLVHIANLGDAYVCVGEAAKAVPLLESAMRAQAIARGNDDLHTLSVTMNLARGYLAVGRSDDALQLGEETLCRLAAKFEGDHRLTLVAVIRLADTYRVAGRPKDALPLYKDALEGLKRILGPDSPELFVAMTSLAWTYHELEQSDTAVPLLVQALAGLERACGTDYPETIWTMAKLGLVHQWLGHHDKAVPLLKRALDCGKAMRGPEHRETLVGMNNLGLAYIEAGQHEEAVALLKEALAADERVLGAGDSDTMTCRANLIDAYRAAGKPEAAAPLIALQAQTYEAKGDREAAQTWRQDLLTPTLAH